MFITNSLQLAEIYLLLSKEWKNGNVYITVKKGGYKPFNNVLVDSFLKVNTIYDYLLENWKDHKLQVFYKESEEKAFTQKDRVALGLSGLCNGE